MINVTSISYAIAALAFFLLSVRLAIRWRSRPYGALLLSACVISGISSALLALNGALGGINNLLTDTVEILRNGVWTAFLIVLLGHYQDPDSTLPYRLRPTLAWTVAFYLTFLGLTVSGVLQLKSSAIFGVTPSMGARVGAAVLGMLLVEQLYRNKPDNERWAIKFACLGIGAMFAYDFYMFSDAMLFHKINSDIWKARGIVNALSVPLIAVSVARSEQWSSQLSVSRRVMFHSAALFGCAIYLLLMGSAGYYLQFFGGSWGALMQVTFLFGALVLLIVILFSGTTRSWLKVFISKHFYSYNYDYREEWLRFTGTLSKHGPGLGHRAIQAIAALVESPGGQMWIHRDNDVFEPIASWNMPATAITETMGGALCHFLQTRQWVIDLQELADDPGKYEGLALPTWLQAYPRGWLIVPMFMQDRLFGFVLLEQPRSTITLNWEVIDLLKIAGNQAASYMAQYEASNALMVARQFESFNRMSTFVVHDLKNLVSQLSLLMANAEKHKHNPAFQQDMIETVDFSVQKMKLLLQKLSRSVTPEQAVALPIERVLRQAVSLKAAFEPTPSLKVSDPGLMVKADWERLERVVGHLIQNAIEATPKDGRVDIELSRAGEAVLIEIVDNGEGMSEEFIRERLFKPFESTKSAGMGIGVFESQEYIRELGGVLDVKSKPGQGTTFKIMLPLLRREAAPLYQAA